MRVPTHGSRDPNYYRALNLNDRVYWGEVCPHGNQLYEDKQRQQGNICVNLASPAIFEPDNAPDVEHEFSEGDAVVIIDCQSFVPEYMPVIRAYEQQRNEILPFNDGLLLNLDASRPADLTNTVLGADAQNKAATEGVFQRSIFDKFGCGSLTNTVTTLPRHLIESLVDDMVLSSTILPLREIRQNATLSQQMQAELVDLLLKATLDFGQLVNFIDSLRNPVHCTQGPPGTGEWLRFNLDNLFLLRCNLDNLFSFRKKLSWRANSVRLDNHTQILDAAKQKCWHSTYSSTFVQESRG